MRKRHYYNEHDFIEYAPRANGKYFITHVWHYGTKQQLVVSGLYTAAELDAMLEPVKPLDTEPAWHSLSVFDLDDKAFKKAMAA